MICEMNRLFNFHLLCCPESAPQTTGGLAEVELVTVNVSVQVPEMKGSIILIKLMKSQENCKGGTTVLLITISCGRSCRVQLVKVQSEKKLINS